jgi:hypothetical protein
VNAGEGQTAPEVPMGEPGAAMLEGAGEAVIPELTPPIRRDKWAHRRVEPRGLALCWTLYLLGVTVASFWTPALGAGLDPLSGRYSARLVLLLAAVGYGVLWPMLRLCQTMPREGGVSAVGKDLIVMVVPTQAVIWPLSFLAVWPVSVAGGVASAALGWTLVVGAVLAVALGRGHDGDRGEAGAARRAGWMLAILALVGTGAGFAAVRLAIHEGGAEMLGADLVMMMSPLTAGFEMTQGPVGRLQWLSPGHWAAVGVTWALALGLWLVAAGVAGMGNGGGDGDRGGALNRSRYGVRDEDRA